MAGSLRVEHAWQDMQTRMDAEGLVSIQPLAGRQTRNLLQIPNVGALIITYYTILGVPQISARLQISETPALALEP